MLGAFKRTWSLPLTAFIPFILSSLCFKLAVSKWQGEGNHHQHWRTGLLFSSKWCQQCHERNAVSMLLLRCWALVSYLYYLCQNHNRRDTNKCRWNCQIGYIEYFKSFHSILEQHVGTLEHAGTLKSSLHLLHMTGLWSYKSMWLSASNVPHSGPLMGDKSMHALTGVHIDW